MPTSIAAKGISATCNRASLLESLCAVSGVCPARSPRAILQNVLLSLSPDGSEFLASDLEIGIHHRILGVQCDEPMRLVLPPARLRAILSTSEDDEVYLAAEGDHVVIRTRRAEFRLPLESADLFPVPPAFDASAYFVVTAADLRKLIRRTITNCDLESARYALGGCLIEHGDDTMTFVATDGRRLARQIVPCSVEGEPTIEGSCVIPVKALKMVDRLLDNDGDQVHIALAGDKAVLFRTETATIYSRLVEGRFPRYQDVLPSGYEARIVFPEIADLKLGIEQAAIVTSETSRGVDFKISDGVLGLSTEASDVGKSQVEIPISYEGKSLAFTADPRYCLDVLKPLDDTAAITLEITDEKSPIVLKTDDSGVFVVMPLTKDR